VQPVIDQYISKIHSIINQQKVSTRIKFMLQDVIELRNVRTMYSYLAASAKGNINGTVLCCIVHVSCAHSNMHTHVSSSHS